LCPITLAPVPSGPSGNGYIISSPKKWLVKIAPALRICFFIVKLALSAYGIPLPLPRILDSVLDCLEAKKNALKAISDAVDNSVRQLKKSDAEVESLRSVDDVLSSSSSTSSGDPTPSQRNQLYVASREVYLTHIHDLLFQLEGGEGRPSPEWIPTQCGMRRHISARDGSVAWVSDEGLDSFHSLGKEAFKK
jgi:hypothetical protein